MRLRRVLADTFPFMGDGGDGLMWPFSGEGCCLNKCHVVQGENKKAEIGRPPNLSSICLPP